MAWDRVRIEPSATEPGHADLFLMTGDRRAAENAIAHLPISGIPSRDTVTADEYWNIMLDALAAVNGRNGKAETVTVETSDGATWEWIPRPEPTA
jgi:hypothetical protein